MRSSGQAPNKKGEGIRGRLFIYQRKKYLKKLKKKLPAWQTAPIFRYNQSDMNITIKVINQRTGEVELDNTPGIEISEYSFSVMCDNANAFADTRPDCQVTMAASNGDFVCIASRNMMKDEDEMPFEEYVQKWYPEFS